MENTKKYNLKKPIETDYYDVEDQNMNMDIIDETLGNKVNKVVGKQLSTEDYTSSEKSKLSGIESGATADQTANEILDLLKTVDSSGSGIDADKLDGHDTSYFETAGHHHNSVYEPIITKKTGFNLNKSDSVTSTSNTILATLKGVKIAYDKAVNAYNLAADMLGATSKAVDSDKLDGRDSSYFAVTTHNHNTQYLGKTAKANDAEKLDGQDGSYYFNKTNYGNIVNKNSFTTTSVIDNSVVSMDSSSAQTVNIASGHVIGAQITLVRNGTGTVTVNPANGVTIRSVKNKRRIKEQYGSVSMIHRGSNIWFLIGSLE